MCFPYIPVICYSSDRHGEQRLAVSGFRQGQPGRASPNPSTTLSDQKVAENQNIWWYMHCRAGEAHDRFIMQQREAAQMCWEREILIAYIFKTASLVWMGGTIKQNRAINWGHLESCHFPFCARLFASIQMYSVTHCQCCVIPAEVPCTRIELSICTGMPNTNIVYGMAHSAQDFSLYLD